MNRVLAWKKAFSEREFRVEFLGTGICFASVMYGYTRYLDWNEKRVDAVRLVDPLLQKFNAVDLTWPIFTVIYLSVIVAAWQALQVPRRVVKAMQVYALAMVFRWITLYLTPLDAPVGIISLKDPVVMFVLESGSILNKDLFFSGHTASMTMLYLMLEKGRLKNLILLATLFVASAVLLQKVHYAIDVFIAPFMTYSAYRIVMKMSGPPFGSNGASSF